ncbi:hypothetical protein Poly30_35990 [Planctomycetes bacterium Poly30]|uniref:Chromosome partition protein Smc n=1 Tax=Saltatorellus ferox TaxID=2528018 RepID=A0A518EVE0_9BACT|nr:hypothetical protein Poly30_35990 [Planctomycetes bacterium Poly30]
MKLTHKTLRTATVLCLVTLPSLAAAQTSDAPQDGGTTLADRPGGSEAATAESLRVKIRDMRMNLLLGGDQVRRAEEEAVDFYVGKTRSVENRMDDVATELVELRASYDVVLDRALETGSEDALREAQPLRSRITSLESEEAGLVKRRERLSELVAAVEERDRDRRRLVDQVESATALPDSFGAPMMSIGLAPPPVAAEASVPLEDDALLNDLLERDPRRAKSLYFAADPDRYWRRFPLKPPTGELRQAMRFPLPDPVGRR